MDKMKEPGTVPTLLPGSDWPGRGDPTKLVNLY